MEKLNLHLIISNVKQTSKYVDTYLNDPSTNGAKLWYDSLDILKFFDENKFTIELYYDMKELPNIKGYQIPSVVGITIPKRSDLMFCHPG